MPELAVEAGACGSAMTKGLASTSGSGHGMGLSPDDGGDAGEALTGSVGDRGTIMPNDARDFHRDHRRTLALTVRATVPPTVMRNTGGIVGNDAVTPIPETGGSTFVMESYYYGRAASGEFRRRSASAPV